MKNQMTQKDIHAFLSAVNQYDPRVETSPFNVAIWHEHISHLTPTEAMDAFKYFTGQSDDKPTPRQIKMAARSLGETRKAQESARSITSDPTKVSFVEFKKRNSGRALAAYQEGYRQTHGRDDPSPPEWTRDDSSASILKSMKF